MPKHAISPSKVYTLIIPQDIARDPCPATGEIGNWTGKLVHLYRKRLIKKNYKPRDDLARPGVYLLFGSIRGKLAVYVGEGEEVIGRVREQLELSFWRDVVVFISKDNNVDKAGIKYLEHKIYMEFKNSGIYRVANRRIPTRPAISAADQAQLDESVPNILMLASRLTGYRF